jgi:hypothetical protein
VHPPLISMTEEGFDEVSIIQHQKFESSVSLSNIEGPFFIPGDIEMMSPVLITPNPAFAG